MGEMATDNDSTAEATLLFDGVCNLCNGAVQFIVKRDPAGRVHFAALQSDAARRLLAEYGLPDDYLKTIVLIENGRAYTHSTAALRVARLLRAPWPAFYYAFIWVPRPVRDLVYGLVARNRYRLFGMREACMVPTPDLRARFLT